MGKYAVLGSGTVGKVLAEGLLGLGHEVTRASRDPAKLAEWRSSAGPKARVGTLEEAARWGERVVVAVKGTAAESAIDLAGPGNLAGKTVIDATNPIADAPPVNGVLQYFTGHGESLMERLQRRAPQARLVKAFSCVGSPFFVSPRFPGGPPTMFICGNDDGAKAEVTGLLGDLGWEACDMGKVEAARAIEPLAMLWCIPGLTRNEWGHAFKLLRLG